MSVWENSLWGSSGRSLLALGLFPRARQVGLQAFPRGCAEHAQPDTGSGLENVAGWHQLAAGWFGRREDRRAPGLAGGGVAKLQDWPDQIGLGEPLRGAGGVQGSECFAQPPAGLTSVRRQKWRRRLQLQREPGRSGGPRSRGASRPLGPRAAWPAGHGQRRGRRERLRRGTSAHRHPPSR